MNLVLDRNFRGIGRIKKSSGTNHRPTFNRINGLLTLLYDRGELQRLRDLKDGKVKPVTLLDEFPAAHRASLSAHAPVQGLAKNGHVYVVRRENSDEVKIGFSTNVGDRLATLQTGNGGALQVLAMVRGTRKTERELHQRFAKYRRRGEWFEASPEIIEWARGLRA